MASAAIAALAVGVVVVATLDAGSVAAAPDRVLFDRSVIVTGEVRADAQITEGAEIYLAACDTCHGASGAAPSIRTVPLDKTEQRVELEVIDRHAARLGGAGRHC